MDNSGRPKDPDADAIRRVGERDEEAFEELVEKYKHAVMNTGYRYVGDYAEAEDIAQEVFVKVWKSASKFRGKSKFSTWLYRIVVNQCLNHRRKRKVNSVPLEEAIGLPGRGVDSQVESRVEERETSACVRRAISSLPERQRMALILSAYEGKSYGEIAGIMGATLSSVTSLIFRAKDNLKKEILPLKLAGEI